MSKKLPDLTSDDEAERFLGTADLSEYDLSAMKPHSFEFAPKSRQMNLRVSDDLMSAVKAKAATLGMSYQRFIRRALEEAVQMKR